MVSLSRTGLTFLLGIIVLMTIFIIRFSKRSNINYESYELPKSLLNEDRDRKIPQDPRKHQNISEIRPNIESSSEKPWFPFLPRNLRYCEELIQNKEEIPSLYASMRLAFDHVLRNQSKVTEGHSGRKKPQTYTYLKLGAARFVKTICETGFNAGHSTLAWLTSNPHTHIYSFDLGKHAYSEPMALFLRNSFPGRLTNIWGDSTITIPHFAKTHPNISCDLLVVDGGHSYKVAMADLRNFQQLANKNYNIVIVDDCPGTRLKVVRAWSDTLKTGYLEEKWRCQFKERSKGGFTIGRYVTNN